MVSGGCGHSFSGEGDRLWEEAKEEGVMADLAAALEENTGSRVWVQIWVKKMKVIRVRVRISIRISI